MAQITIDDLLVDRDGQKWIAISSEVDDKIFVKPAQVAKATKKKLSVKVKQFTAFIIAVADVEHVVKPEAKKKQVARKKSQPS